MIFVFPGSVQVDHKKISLHPNLGTILLIVGLTFRVFIYIYLYYIYSYLWGVKIYAICCGIDSIPHIYLISFVGFLPSPWDFGHLANKIPSSDPPPHLASRQAKTIKAEESTPRIVDEISESSLLSK